MHGICGLAFTYIADLTQRVAAMATELWAVGPHGNVSSRQPERGSIAPILEKAG